MWDFPNCLGAINGKHIAIRPPPHTGRTPFSASVLSATLQACQRTPSCLGATKSCYLSFWQTTHFLCNPYIMKPFPFQKQTASQRVFSYRVSRGRHTVENGFGRLANRFRLFQGSINLSPEKVDTIVLACTVLHNIFRGDKITQCSQTEGSLEIEIISDATIAPGLWRQMGAELMGLQVVGRNASMEGKMVRDMYWTIFRVLEQCLGKI